MTYFCKDCSYRGKTSGQGGECPACGSHQLVGGKIKEDEPPPPRWRLYLLIGLWTYLIGHITWKLLN
mgnify:CR=1 FL=1